MKLILALILCITVVASAYHTTLEKMHECINDKRCFEKSNKSWYAMMCFDNDQTYECVEERNNLPKSNTEECSKEFIAYLNGCLRKTPCRYWFPKMFDCW